MSDWISNYRPWNGIDWADWFSAPAQTITTNWTLCLDIDTIISVKDGYVVRVDLPGRSPETINVEVSGKTLVITDPGFEPKLLEGQTLVYGGVGRSNFSKVIELEKELDPNSAIAKYKDGVLEITVNLLNSSKSKKIKIT
jgi:HSP20 family molecular chaperone IbpA